MSKTGSGAKVKLNSFDDLFGTEQPQTGTEQVQEIALSELHGIPSEEGEINRTLVMFQKKRYNNK